MSATPPVARTRALEEVPQLAALALQMLPAPSLTLPFTVDDARALLPFLRLVDAPRGTLLLAAGDVSHTAHMLFLLQGDVSVELMVEGDSLPLSVLGPGQFIGELSLLDGQPRSANCVALTDVRAAGLSRTGLQRLVAEQPALAARLMALLATRIAERMRALGDQIKFYAQISPR